MRVLGGLWRALLLLAAVGGAYGAAAQASRQAGEAVQRGQAAEDAGDYDRAVREFSEAAKLDPACGQCFFYRALIYKYNKKDCDNAIADYTESLRLSPKSYVEYKGRGECYMAKGEYAAAVSDFESYLRFESGDPDAKSKLAEAKKKAERGGGGGDPARVIDQRDGKTYKIALIGNQTWTAENMNYQSGNSWCLDNGAPNCGKYGRLYDWNAARGACPPGWRLPSLQDWETLEDAIGGKAVAGKKLKTASGWNGDGNGADDFGFSALPGGFRNPDGSFAGVGNYGKWWTSTEFAPSTAYSRLIYRGYGNIQDDTGNKGFGFSVRCVMGK